MQEEQPINDAMQSPNAEPNATAEDSNTALHSEVAEAAVDFDPAEMKQDETVNVHPLTGMYQNWFLDYASYVILERAVPHLYDGLKPVHRPRWDVTSTLSVHSVDMLPIASPLK